MGSDRMIIPVEDYESYIDYLTGYQLTDDDEGLIAIIEQQESRHILNYTNLETIPDGLKPTLMAMAAGDFLTVRKAKILGADNLQVITSIKEGDVQVNLGGTSNEARLDSLIDELKRERDLQCYRKLAW